MNMIDFRMVQRLAAILPAPAAQADLSARLEDIAASEESARALINALLNEYGYQEAALMIFPYLTEEEQSRILSAAFGDQ